MKSWITVAFAILLKVLPAQVTDQFSDGNFTDNPHWTGDSLSFEVNSLLQLHLKTDGADTAALVTSTGQVPVAEWRFWIKLSFNPSSNNYSRIYLTADQPALTEPLTGYFLQAGGIDDSISLFRQEGILTVKLMTCPGFSANHPLNAFRFRITRSSVGTWEVFADSSGGQDWVRQGGFTDNTITNGRWTGVFCRFTSSNSARFYFDDFYAGPIQNDTMAPEVTGLITESDHQLRIIFSEPVGRENAEDPENYLVVVQGIHPATATRDPFDPKAVSLIFADPFQPSSCDSLKVTGISDQAGNKTADTSVFFCNYTEHTYDVVIDEIMADPDPPAGLPGAEYIELYNRSEFPLRLEGWTLEYGYNSRAFPDLSLPSHGYLVVSSDSVMAQFGPLALVFTSPSALSNSGMRLTIRNPAGQVIHSVQYTVDWYSGTFKNEGGWSLEMIDPGNPCACSDNWTASMDPAGGTPGRINSANRVNPDTVTPVLSRGVILSGNSVRTVFSEPLDSNALTDPGNWSITGNGQPPDSIRTENPDHISAILFFHHEFEPGIEYTLSCEPAIMDCAGNPMEEQGRITVAVPEKPAPGGIVINEILPEPYAGGSRYVELYNRGETPVDLFDLALSCSTDTTCSDPGIPWPVSNEHFLMMPESYVALCGNVKDVRNRYMTVHPEAFAELDPLPAFGPEQGQVCIYRKSDECRIDRVVFDHSMHHPLLANTAGVSLERVSPWRPSGDPGNWHSAASSAGYGTPGALNSQWFEATPDDGAISLQPRIFSPDNDGKDDLLNIVFSFDSPGYLANITVYDSRGKEVRQLENSVLEAPRGCITWDGLNENHQRVDVGIYIILVEIFQPDGKVRKYKKTAVVASLL